MKPRPPRPVLSAGAAANPALVAALCLLAVVLAACATSETQAGGLEPYRAKLRALGQHPFAQTTRIVDRNGRLLAELAPDGRRMWVNLDEVPIILQDAVIATEDQTFYSNSGVDASAIARAAIQNAESGGTVSGASTISMQLVRLVAFDTAERFDQSLDRKVREAHLASELSEMYTKREILEAYLNLVYFGHGAYGVEAASQAYFGKSVKDASDGEATLLAGLIQAPSLLDPWQNMDGAKARQRIVLNRLVATSRLLPVEADALAAEPVALRESPTGAQPTSASSYFVDYVRAQLPIVLGRSLAARGGYTVTTTLDLALNERLSDLAKQQINKLKASNDVGDAAVVAMRPGTGEVLAMVGGVDYTDPKHGQVNAAISRRQPGSSFKPITYAAALERGWQPYSVLWDIPWTFGANSPNPYRPTNYDGKFNGPVRLDHALANSLNAAAVDLINTIGVENVFELAQSFGLNLVGSSADYGVSLTLGGAEVTPLDLTTAYAALANGGMYVPAAVVLRVEPFEGGGPVYVLSARPRPVVRASTAYVLAATLSDADKRRPAFGRGGPLEISQPAAVKTGTTNDFRDNWTLGFTPDLAVGVWVGNKDGHPMRSVLGITGAAPLWHDAMTAIYTEPQFRDTLLRSSKPTNFVQPGGVTQTNICDLGTATRGGCIAKSTLTVSDAGDAAFAASGLVAIAGGRCLEGDPSSPGVAVGLRVDRPSPFDAQVRSYASSRGIRLAPAGCP